MAVAPPRTKLDLDQRPMLVFWETTRACLLACRHCRASAMPDPLPGELSTPEGRELIRSLTDFGRPYPVLVLTGGDVLMRTDVYDLAAYAASLKIPVALAPSVTGKLSPDAARRMREAGVKAVSISLDGAVPGTHDGIRGIDGHFAQTLAAIRMLRAYGFVVQVNTVVMRDNVEELPEVAAAARAPARERLGGLLPHPYRPRRADGGAFAGRERGRLPLPLRRLPLRVRGTHGRGAVLPAGGRLEGR